MRWRGPSIYHAGRSRRPAVAKLLGETPSTDHKRVTSQQRLRVNLDCFRVAEDLAVMDPELPDVRRLPIRSTKSAWGSTCELARLMPCIGGGTAGWDGATIVSTPMRSQSNPIHPASALPSVEDQWRRIELPPASTKSSHAHPGDPTKPTFCCKPLIREAGAVAG